MQQPIFLNLAFGAKYIEQQKRCNASILAVYPDAHIKSWTDEYPPGSRTHAESLYGFKVHAVQWAIDAGYSRVVWLDTACVLNRGCEDWWKLTPMYGVLAAKDDNKLEGFIGDRYYKHKQEGTLFSEDNSEIKELHLIGGSLYVWDFDIVKAKNIFREWMKDEANGWFGSQEEQSSGNLNKHRHDETCLAVCMYDWWGAPVTCEQLSYNTGNNPIVSKYHFK